MCCRLLVEGDQNKEKILEREDEGASQLGQGRVGVRAGWCSRRGRQVWADAPGIERGPRGETAWDRPTIQSSIALLEPKT